MSEPIYDGRKEPLWGGEGGGLYFRTLGPYEAGHVHEGHRHYQDHWSILLAGSVRVKYRTEQGGPVVRSAVYIAPYKFVVDAEVWHEIEALETGTVWSCCFVVPADVDRKAMMFHHERADDPIEQFGD